MKLLKKNLINKKRLLVLFVTIVILGSFLNAQYQSYQHLPKPIDTTTVPVDGAKVISTNWRYFAIPYENISSEEEMHKLINVRTTPHYDHEVSFISQKELNMRSIKDDIAHLRSISNGRFDEFMNSYFPSTPWVTIERTGKSFEPNTKYTIIVTSKPFNIFYYLLGTKSKTYTFTTTTSTVDEHEANKRLIQSSLGTFLSTAPTKEDLERQKKIKETCQLSNLESLYIPVDKEGKPLREPINSEYYELNNLECDTVNFTGETVTVLLKDPRGKAEFEQFLKDNNVNLKLLKITYKNQ